MMRHHPTSVVYSQNSWGVGLVAAVQTQKNLEFFSYGSLEAVFAALKLPQNFSVMNIGSPTCHIYAA